MTIEEIRSKLQDALAALEVPSPMALRHAERFTDEANAALRELTDPPDPYKDMTLRPGLSRSSEHDVTNYEGKSDV